MSVSFDMRRPPSGMPDPEKPGKETELDEVLYVRIELGPANIVHRPATDEDKARYADEFKAYEAEQKKGNVKPTKASDAVEEAKNEPKREAAAPHGSHSGPRLDEDGKHKPHKHEK